MGCINSNYWTNWVILKYELSYENKSLEIRTGQRLSIKTQQTISIIDDFAKFYIYLHKSILFHLFSIISIK